MTTMTPRSVRYSFVTFLVALTAFTVVESAVGGRAAATAEEGLSTCGTEARPCTLDAVAVQVKARPVQPHLADAEGLSACGTRDEPCLLEAVSVSAEAGGLRLASTESAPPMVLRLGS